jgi:hypothetical protein
LEATVIRPNTAEGLVFRARDTAGEPVTGLAVTVKVFDPSNGQIWDWSTSAFSASPVTPTTSMTEVDAVNLPGYYYRSWPGAAEGTYLAECSPPAGQTDDDYPDPVELRVTPYVLSTEVAAVQTDVDDIQARLPAALVDGRIDASVGAMAANTVTASALAADAVAEVQSGLASQASVDALPDAVWDEALSGHATAGTAGAALALVDVAVSSRATNAGVWATATDNTDWTYGECLSLARKHITNRLDVSAAGNGALTLYDDNGTTAIVVQTLRDGSGDAIVTPTGSPALRGAAS